MKYTYSSPPKSDRECKYGWFDLWNSLVNRSISLAGSAVVKPGAGEIAFDPHIHTMFSHCSISQAEAVILRSVKAGLGGIAIMDHNDTRGAEDAIRCVKYLKEKQLVPESFYIIPGVEINTTKGHVGAWFFSGTPPKPGNPLDVVEEIHKAGALAVAVHPYHSTGIGDAVFDIPFDAVEISCGAVFDKKTINKHLEFAKDPRISHLAQIGSSDAHYTNAIASCYTVIKAERLSEDIIRQAISEKNTRPMSADSYKKTCRLLGNISKLK